MKIIIVASVALFGLIPLSAEAARCPKGTIYYRSAGKCVSKASAIRAGIYRPRVVKARIKHRYKRRPPVQRARVEIPSAVYPPPKPLWMQRTPVVEGFAPERIALSPFGKLIDMPDTLQSQLARWAAQNVGN